MPFFEQKILNLMDLYGGVECTVSVPLERFAVLKEMIESRSRWRRLDGRYAYFVSNWMPKSWPGPNTPDLSSFLSVTGDLDRDGEVDLHDFSFSPITLAKPER